MDNIKKANDTIEATKKMMFSMFDTANVFKKDTTIDENVREILMEIARSEIKFMARQIRKQYKILEKDAVANKKRIGIFEKNVFEPSSPWGKRSDGR